MNNYLSIGKTAQFLGVSTVTLRRWEKSGKITSSLTFENHCRFQHSNLIKLNKKEKLDIGYARVFSHDQKQDLIRQSDVSNQSIVYKNKMITSALGRELFFNICALLAEDVIELMTVFSAKLYGKRSHKNKNILM